MALREVTSIGEAIEVIALFDRGMRPLRPLRFRWQGRVHRIRELTFTWSTMEGADHVVHFSVHDGSALYELSYNKATLRWTLENVAVP